MCVTDIPIETTNGTVVADVSQRDGTALMSLPRSAAYGCVAGYATAAAIILA